MFTFKRNQIIITVLVFMIAIAAYLNTKEPVAGVKPNLVEDMNAEEKDFFAEYDAVIQELPPDEETEVFAEGVVQDQVTDKAANAQVIDKEENTLLAPEATQAQVTDEATNALLVPDAQQGFEAVITKKSMVTAGGDVESVEAVGKNMDVSYFVEEKILREQNRASQVEQLTQYVANESLDKESKSKAAENLLEIQQRIEKESSAEALLRAKGFKEVYVRIDENSVDVVINKEDLTDSDIAQIEEIVNRKTGYSVGKIKITPLKGISKEGEN